MALGQPDAATFPVSGDLVAGDKVKGDKVLGDKHVHYHQASAPTRSDRNRRAMLEKVRSIWVEGLLAISFDTLPRFALRLEEHPDAVDLALRAQVQELLRSPRTIAEGVPVAAIFERTAGALLILGAPGAGKTTLLLELACDLIDRAMEDEQLPIPVVFNLSSWSKKRLPLDKWLVEELRAKYDVSRKVGGAWVASDALLPLLDGLDEVLEEHRAACVEAINAYRSEHGLVPMAVCCRDADYEALGVKLRLQGAVVVQPPSLEQIDTYLAAAGPQLASFRAAWSRDSELRTLSQSPLLITIMALAFNDRPVELLPSTATAEEQYSHLFNIYIQRMLSRRGSDPRYPRERTMRCLSWLARQMSAHQQETFLLEQIDAASLTSRSGRIFYYLLLRVAGALVFLVSCGLIGAVATMANPNGVMLQGLRGGLILGGVLALAAVLSSLLALRLPKVVAVVLTVCVATAALAILRAEGLPAAMLNGLVIGLPGALVGLFFTGRGPIRFIRAFRWSGPQHRRRLGQGLLASLALAVLFGLVAGPVPGLVFGLFIGVCCMIPVLLLEMTRGDLVQPSATPNQVVWRSLRTAVAIFVALLCLCLLIGSVWGLQERGDIWQGLAFGLVMGIVLGLVVGLAGGGSASIQHFLLRAVLASSGVMTWQYQRFLDYATNRMFLRRVGSGYSFYHRVLLEHFAKKYT